MTMTLAVCSVLSLVTVGLALDPSTPVGTAVDPSTPLGPAVDPSTPVGQMTLSQLTGELANFIRTHIQPLTNCSHDRFDPEPVLNETCVDDSKASDCSLVVAKQLCNKEPFYARYCCRSCTLARQIPTSGAHLDGTAKAPITVSVSKERDTYLEGSDVSLTCVTSGFPPPEIVWFWRDQIIRPRNMEYEEKITELGGLFIKEVRSDLIVKNVVGNDSINVECMAINRDGKSRYEVILYLQPAMSVLHPEVPVFTLSEPKVLEFVVNGSRASDVTFSIPEVNYTTSESESFEDGVKTITYRLTLQNATVGGYRFRYDHITDGSLRDRFNSIYIVPDAEVPDGCTDVVRSTDCIQSYRQCERRALTELCCRSCILFRNTSIHIPLTPWPGLVVRLHIPWYEISYGSTQKLHCDADSSFGNVTFTWLKENHQIQNSHKYLIQDNYSERNGVGRGELRWVATSSLTISEIEARDTGTYRCGVTSDTELEYSAAHKLVFLKKGEFRFEYVYVTD